MMRTFGEEKYDYQKYSGSHMTENGIKIVLKNFSRKSFFSIFFNISSSSRSFHNANFNHLCSAQDVEPHPLPAGKRSRREVERQGL